MRFTGIRPVVMACAFAAIPTAANAEIVLPITPCDPQLATFTGHLTAGMPQEDGTYAFMYGADNFNFVSIEGDVIQFHLNLRFVPPLSTVFKLFVMDDRCDVVYGDVMLNVIPGANIVSYDRVTTENLINGAESTIIGQSARGTIRYIWIEVWDGVAGSANASYSYLVDVQNPENPTGLIRATISRTAPFDFFDSCNHSAEAAGGPSQASAIVFSNPLDGAIELNVQSAGSAASAVGRAGVGVTYVPDFSGTVRIRTVVEVSGFDVLSATGLRVLRINLTVGSAFVQSSVFVSAVPPVDSPRTMSTFRSGLIAPTRGFNPGKPLLVVDEHRYNPPEEFASEHTAIVLDGQPLQICAGLQTSTGATTLIPGIFVSSKALYFARVQRIEITPQ